MADMQTSNQEPKKEKNIKHGMLALTAIGIAILLIVTGIYLYGQYHLSKKDLAPVTPEQTSTATSSQPS